MVKANFISGALSVLQGSYQTLIGCGTNTKVLNRVGPGWPKMRQFERQHIYCTITNHNKYV